MKPEVCAPGSNIYSAQPGGGYQYLNGTSMAGPHVAGVVALMFAANPNLDVETVKQVLMDTAIDLGTAGEDNTYGHGFINAYDAVTSVMGGLGTVSGTVTDAGTSLPLAGVEVGVVGSPVTRTTGADGQFQFMLPVGQRTLTFERFAYANGSRIVEVLENQTVDGSIAMTALPTALLSGVVRDYENATVAGATVQALGTPLAPVQSGPDGSYSIQLPAGATYDMLARAAGYGADQHTIDFQGAMTLDFVLPELTAEDFESGNFLMYPWEMGGDAPWIIGTLNPYEGTYSARSGDIGDYDNSDLQVTVQVVASGDIKFWYRVSTEANYDYLRFYVDGTQVASWAGTVPWTQYTYPVGAGTHTFKWSYTKDQSVSTGEDAVWVDFIEFPALGEIPYPSATLSHAIVEATVPPGEVAQSEVTLGNVGEAEMSYSVAIEYNTRSAATPAELGVPYHELAKGAPDVYTGEPPVTASGGPDAFGYTWIDSDSPGGPTYEWVEISGIGTVVGGGDDSNLGPFPLGFGFPYYGQTFTSVRVCTNGWLSFTSTTNVWTNQTIPNAADPNNLVAGFWDDLVPNVGGTIYYYADAANGRFIVEWNEVPHYPSGSPETFQIILYASGTIVYQYKTVALGTSCTVGIENATGTDGLQVLYNAAGYLHNGLAIRFALDPTLTWLSVSPTSGQVAAPGSVQLGLTMDATDLPVGEYYADVLISTNDPNHPLLTLPVFLVVSEMAGVDDEQPAAFAFYGAAPNPLSSTTALRFHLDHAGDVDLRIYDVAGRLVRTLVSGRRTAGSSTVRWDGADNGGSAAASGTYFARLVFEGRAETRSLTLVR
jgi:hypothetical protein